MTSKYSTFVKAEKRADVVKVDGTWGCLFFVNGEEVKQELYKGHSESYAESAAENYVEGVKHL
tara:strand:- start:159 stop:347 length:189 start_codon:yes stop_codon:yes gene_type:complete